MVASNKEWPSLGQRPSSTTATSTAATTVSLASSTTAILSSTGNNKQLEEQLQKTTSTSTAASSSNNHKNPQQPPKPTTTKVSDTSILAPKFVPAKSKDILTMPVGRYLPIMKSPNPTVDPLLTMCQQMFFALVAPAPICFCSHSDKPQQQQQQQPHHELPWTMIPPMDMMEPNYVFSKKAMARRRPRFTKKFPSSVYEVIQQGGRDKYLIFFKGLLREEFEEIMMLYDRYTQFSTPVKPVGSRSWSNDQVESVEDQPFCGKVYQELFPHKYQYYPLRIRCLQQEYTKSDTGRKQAIHRASIDISGIADARPSLQPGDHVLLRCPMKGNVAGEILTQVEDVLRANGTSRLKDRIIVTWEDNVMQVAKKKVDFNAYNFSVRFLPSITKSQRCFTALKWLHSIKPHIAKNLLFPAVSEEETNNNISDDDDNPLSFVVDTTDPQNLLNDQQSRFCQLVKRRTNNPSLGAVRPPIILTGPAGTGKTKALLMSILTTLGDSPQHRILICTPSNIAADVIARRLMKHIPPKEIFRLCDPSRPVSTVPVDILPLMRQNTQNGAGSGEFTLPTTADEFINFRVIVCTCVDAHILYLCGMTNASLRSRRQCLQSFISQALLKNSPGTSIKGSSEGESFLEGIDKPHFTHLFIDEACQATEPETLIPFSVVVDDEPHIAKVEIALTGDPRQLNPEVYSPWARSNLQVSMLERLLQQQGGRRQRREEETSHMLGPVTKDSWVTMDELLQYSLQTSEQQKEEQDNLSVFLTLSYRGHPSFLMVPSKLFYHDKLRSVKNNSMIPHEHDAEHDKWCQIVRQVESLSTLWDDKRTAHKKVRDWPIHCRGVIGKDTSVAVYESWGSNSWSNPQEAQVIVEMIHFMVTKLQVPTMDIGVMAAFRAQVVLIRQLLRSKQLGAVNVGLVEDYQSAERQIVLLSLTRSNPRFIPSDLKSNAGLYEQPKRMNVALTRALQMLVVVGNPNTMEQDPYWSTWLNFCKCHELYYSSPKNKDRRSPIQDQINASTVQE